MFLTGLAIALAARQGLAALLLLMAASLAGDWPRGPMKDQDSLQRQVFILLIAAAIIAWRQLRCFQESKAVANQAIDQLEVLEFASDDLMVIR